MKPFAASYPINPGGHNGDGYVSFSLGERCWIGIVADAPSSAQSGSAGVLINAVDTYLETRGKEAIGREIDSGLGERVLADIMTVANERMVSESGNCWAAVVFVLVGSGKVYLGSVGDCAVYLGLTSGLCYRYSDTTRVGGSCILPEATDLPGIMHVREGVYLGDSRRTFGPGDLDNLDRNSVKRLLLLSDGLEEVIGATRLRDFLIGKGEVPFEKSTLSDWIREKTLVDDTTFLGAELDPIAQVVEETKDELTETEHESEVKSVSSESQEKKPSFLRRFFGFLLTLAGIGLLGFVAWKFALLYLKESGTIEPEQTSVESAVADPAGDNSTEKEPLELETPESQENSPPGPEN